MNTSEATPDLGAQDAPERGESAARLRAISRDHARDIRAPVPVLKRLAESGTARRVLRAISLMIFDLAGVAAGVVFAIGLYAALGPDQFNMDAVRDGMVPVLPLIYGLTVLLFAEAGLYSSREVRPSFTRSVGVLSRVALITLFVVLLGGTEDTSVWVWIASLAFAAAFVCGLRLIYMWATYRLLLRVGYRRRAVIIGTAAGIEGIAPTLGAAHQTAYETVGCFTIGESTNLPAWLDENPVEEVIIADPDLPQERAVGLIDECQARGLQVRIAPSTLEVLTARADPVPGEGVPLLEIRKPSFTGLDYAMKRGFDFFIAAGLLVVLSPFLLVVALLVKLTSSGPVLHRSLRPGIGGAPFRCLKFRTMYEGAERRQHELEHLNEATGPIFKIREDPRVTPLGRFLRRNSIDELPQLINVLRGQLSLVGPRPLPLRDHARLEPWHRRRNSVLPGITGLWQVSGRSNLTFDDMVRLDFLYIERWSVLLDLTILLKTIPAVARRRGAY